MNIQEKYPNTQNNSQKADVKDDRFSLVEKFTETNPEYYQKQFKKIGSTARFTWTFNLVAALLGPIWFGMRHLWHYGLPFLIVEALALVQISRGFWGDLSADIRERIAQVESTLELRREQLDAAIRDGADNIDVYKRIIASLENAIGDIRLELNQAEDAGIWIALSGIVILVLVKLTQGLVANSLLERRFSDWLSDRTLPSGLSWPVTLLSLGFVAVIFGVGIIHYAFPGTWSVIGEFPTRPVYRLESIEGIREFFSVAVLKGEWFFEIITEGIRFILDSLEVLFVETPWIMIASFIVLLTALSAGPKAAVFCSVFLAYIGLLGFWEKAMTTLALLGTAACISIILGIPLGMFCARRPKVYAVIRPIMDFMQTMPSFVFMIPVIAFFGTGKPAAVITTMIFGGTPVVRLTVLGLRGVPETIREAAIAYGASKWYLLTRVDLPLAAPSILAGVNQTIMLSLAMVVVASLIGAKGLGEDVLEALQYSSVGQGILAGFCILFCAMILNSIVQGKRKRA